MSDQAIHVPVLLEEVLDGLQVRPGGTYVDCTIGTGGHARAILDRSSPDGRLLGIDLDCSALAVAARRLVEYEQRTTLVCDSFANLHDIAIRYRYPRADGILLDLGVSTFQLQDRERGFSFQDAGPLDMRFDLSADVTARSLVNGLREAELAQILADYGEEQRARAIARAIVKERPLNTTSQLADLVAQTVGRRRKVHPATKTFQALRIAVNQEMRALSDVLPQTLDVLATGGRVAVIAFHSLEDRLVKRFMAQEARDCICPPELPMCVCNHRRTLQVLTRKPIRPSDAEIHTNPRARSARLRIAVRL